LALAFTVNVISYSSGVKARPRQ